MSAFLEVENIKAENFSGVIEVIITNSICSSI